MSKTNRYPDARGGSRNSPRGYQPGFSPRARPKPANDNRPRIRPPIPANDNWKGVPRPGFNPPAYVGGLPAAAAWRAAARFLPWVGIAFLLADLLLWLLQWRMNPPGSAYVRCSPDDPNKMIDHWNSGVCAVASPLPTGPGVWSAGRSWWHTTKPTVPGAQNAYRTVTRTLYPADPGIVPVYVPPRVVPQPLPDPFMLPDPPPWYEPLTPPWRPRPEPESPPIRNRPDRPYTRPEDSEKGEPSSRENPRTTENPRRPTRGERETKKKGSKSFRQFLGEVLSAYSEGSDIIEALHDALPKEFQAKAGANILDQFKALYENPDKIDMVAAAQELWENHQEDRIWGKQFKRMTDAFEGYGIELPSLRGFDGPSFMR